MARLRKYILAIATVFALGLAAAVPADAAPLVFAERTTFNTSAGSTSTVDFNSAVANNGFDSSLTFAGIQFSYVGPTAGSPDPGVGVVNAPGYGTTNNALGINAPNTFATVSLIITPTTGTRAFGFDFKGSNSSQVSTVSAASYTLTINFADNTSLITTITNPAFNTFSFFGFTSDVDILSLSIATNNGGQPLLDNVSFGPAAAPAEVPEPATMILFGTGLAGLASMARKRRLRGLSSESEDESPEA